VLALQKINGYVNFSLAPPHVDSDGVPHYEIMRVIFEPTKISADQLLKIIAVASGLEVTP
jgi:peptide methionine sulfoxide reductase MsrA